MDNRLADTFLRLSDPLYRYAYSRLGRKLEAEEAVQDVFLAVLKKPPKEMQDSYLFQAVRNRCIDLQRRESREAKVNLDWVQVSELKPVDRDQWLDLQKFIPSLPDEQQEALILRSLCGLTLAEIAYVQDVSVSTVASRHRYALEHLRRKMAPENEEVRR